MSRAAIQRAVVRLPLPAIIVEEGETLSHIAERELGSVHQWQILAHANHLADPSSLLPGDIIVISARQIPFRVRRHAF